MRNGYILLCTITMTYELEERAVIFDFFISMLDSLSTMVGIFLSVITGVSMIFGMRYLKSLKEKKLAASFSFWSQIKLKIIQLLNYMLSNKEIINNFYSTESRLRWEEKEVAMQQLEEFKKLTVDIIKYLDETPDQMPAYIGWSNDMLQFIDFLSKVVQYDICKSDSMYLKNGIVEKEERDAYYADICNTMQSLIDGIQRGQAELEVNLFPRKRTNRIT